MFLRHPLGRVPIPHVLALLATWLSWSLFSSTSWFGGGPAHLVLLLVHRAQVYALQCATLGGELGLFVPTRYLWPVALAALLGLSILLPRVWHRLGTPTIPRNNARLWHPRL